MERLIIILLLMLLTYSMRLPIKDVAFWVVMIVAYFWADWENRKGEEEEWRQFKYGHK